jgi:hypothetical protein
MPAKTLCLCLLGLLIDLGSDAAGQSGYASESDGPQPLGSTGSALTEKDARALLEYHNKVRREVGVASVRWSPALATFAQKWADELASTGKLQHRPREGEWKQQYGENIAWGKGVAYGALRGAEHWYNEIEYYAPGTSIPRDRDGFKGAHYTQMVWKDTTEIGAGQAIIRIGDKKGWVVVVCNYNPPGNIAGEMPY